MRGLASSLLVCSLMGCGADGEPVPPTRDATITLSDAGVSGQARVGLSEGPVRLTLGVGF